MTRELRVSVSRDWWGAWVGHPGAVKHCGQDRRDRPIVGRRAPGHLDRLAEGRVAADPVGRSSRRAAGCRDQPQAGTVVSVGVAGAAALWVAEPASQLLWRAADPSARWSSSAGDDTPRLPDRSRGSLEKI